MPSWSMTRTDISREVCCSGKPWPSQGSQERWCTKTGPGCRYGLGTVHGS
jgi:hypothetical protein